MNSSNPQMDKVLRWVARAWSLPAIIFVFGEIVFPHTSDATVPFTDWLALGLQITAVFSLAIAWRWEIFGGTLSILTMLSSFVILTIARGDFLWEAALVWTGFIIAPAALFLYCGMRTRPNELKTT